MQCWSETSTSKSLCQNMTTQKVTVLLWGTMWLFFIFCPDNNYKLTVKPCILYNPTFWIHAFHSVVAEFSVDLSNLILFHYPHMIPCHCRAEMRYLPVNLFARAWRPKSSQHFSTVRMISEFLTFLNSSVQSLCFLRKSASRHVINFRHFFVTWIHFCLWRWPFM